MQIKRRKTRVVKIGNLSIGGNHPVAIQSMVKARTADIRATVRQIKQLEASGCEIVRVAVRDDYDAFAIKKIKQGIKLPLVADIHFNWRLALAAIESGADKIRLNPGNIYQPNEVREVAAAAKLHHIPIRVGINSGSIRRGKGADAMVKSALDYLRILEKAKFYDIVVSLKGSNILETIEACRKIAIVCDYPLHLGVTATGSPFSGAIKSALAIGALLLEGYGDTIRVSLTDEPGEEVRAAKAILEALGLRHFGPEIISCPTCGRCEVDLIKIVKELEDQLLAVSYQLSAKPLKVAVMGCVVNGPGEAAEADLGIAFGKKDGLLFKRGKSAGKVSYADCVSTLLREIRRLNA